MVQTARPAPFSNAAPTDEAIDFNRRIAARLMQQGTSTEPVGHWTAALARALQGASGSMWNAQARQGEQDAEASVQAALSGKMDPRTLMANPRTRGIGLQVWQSQQAEARAARERAEARNDPMRQLQLQKAQMEIDQLKRQQQFDNEFFGAPSPAAAPAQAAPQPAPAPMPSAPQVSPAMGARAAANGDDPTRAGTFAAPNLAASMPSAAAPATTESMTPAQRLRAEVQALPPDKQAAFMQYWRNGNRTEALKLLTRPDKGAVEFDKKVAENAANDLEKRMDVVRDAQGKLGVLDQFEAIVRNPDVYQGKGGDAILELQKVAAAVGIDIKGLDDAQLLQSLGNQFALRLRSTAGGEGMPGALSDQDRKFLVSMVPGLTKTPEGNLAIIQLMRETEQYKIRANNEAARFIRENRTNLGLGEHMNAWMRANPMLSEETKKRVSEFAGRKQKDIVQTTRDVAKGAQASPYAQMSDDQLMKFLMGQ